MYNEIEIYLIRFIIEEGQMIYIMWKTILFYLYEAWHILRISLK